MSESAYSNRLYVRTSQRRPTFITGAALMGMTQKVVALPEGIDDMPLPERYHVIGGIIRRHYAESDGECPLFGQIVGYAFRHAPGIATLFDVEGQVEGDVVGFVEDAGVAVAQIGRHQIIVRESSSRST